MARKRTDRFDDGSPFRPRDKLPSADRIDYATGELRPDGFPSDRLARHAGGLDAPEAASAKAELSPTRPAAARVDTPPRPNDSRFDLISRTRELQRAAEARRAATGQSTAGPKAPETEAASPKAELRPTRAAAPTVSTPPRPSDSRFDLISRTRELQRAAAARRAAAANSQATARPKPQPSTPPPVLYDDEVALPIDSPRRAELLRSGRLKLRNPPPSFGMRLFDAVTIWLMNTPPHKALIHFAYMLFFGSIAVGLIGQWLGL